MRYVPGRGPSITRRPPRNTSSNANTNSRGVMLPLEPATTPIISDTYGNNQFDFSKPVSTDYLSMGVAQVYEVFEHLREET